MKKTIKDFTNTSKEDLYKKGIYTITHSKTESKYYVGSTKCKGGFYKRWYQHLYSLRKNIHHSPHLQNIYNKYGEEGILFSIQEEIISLETISDREQYWLDFYDSNYITTNYAPIVDAHCLAMTDEVKSRISKSLKGKYTGSLSFNKKTIYKYSSYGDFIKEYDSIIECVSEIGSANHDIDSRDKPVFHKGFLFTRVPLTEEQTIYFNKYGSCKKYWCRKPILQYDLDENLIKEWSCTEEAAFFYNISSGALNQALRGKVKICKNSIWKYLNWQNPWDSKKIIMK